MNLAFRLAQTAERGPRLPGSLQVNRRLDQWLRLADDGCVDVFSGKVELGQGILTALAQIVAEELELPLPRVRMMPASTARSPDEAVTSGSLSVQESGAALRHACAEVRALLLTAAAGRLNVTADALRLDCGEVVAPDGRRIAFCELRDGLLDREAQEDVLPRPVPAHRVVGQSAARLDLPDKVFGRARFLHDLKLPGMLHGRMLRPPSRAATLRALDEQRAAALPDVVAVVRDGSLCGVIARTERAAARAIDQLARDAQWDERDTLPDEAGLAEWLRTEPCETSLIAERRPSEAAAIPPSAVRTVRASYLKPFIAHASLAPSCAIAQWSGHALQVRTHSQGIYNLRRDLAIAFASDEADVVVRHAEGAGCYGHNGADDVAYDAAWLARATAAAGAPVRVLWSRADELGWSPLGPAMLVELEADVDAAGSVIAWRHAVRSNGHSLRPGRAATPTLLGSWHLERPFPEMSAINAPLAAGGGAERNAVPSYDFLAWQAVKHRVLSMPLRTSALRALGAYANVFATESFLDELAQAARIDPLEYRLRHLADARGRAVLERAAAMAGWAQQPRVEGRGRGIGYARYKNTGAWCAVVADVEVAEAVRLRRLWIAADVGLVINPDGVVNQIEGGAIQAASWTLLEQVRFDRRRVTSDAWEHYPILRFSDVPQVEVALLGQPGHEALGAGEASLGPTAAAIANAVAAALGVRVRQLPLTPERIIAAIDQSS